MPVSSSKKLLVGVVLLGWLSSATAAQQEAGKKENQEEIDPRTTTRVTLGSSSGTPGTSIVVPIYFSPAEGIEVGQLRVEVNYVSANLKFSKLDSGIAAQMGNVDLKSDVKEGKNDKGVETQTVIITGSVESPQPQNRGIGPGLLGYLNMQISENGRPANITLKASVEATQLGTNKTIPNVRAVDAIVEVQAPGTEPAVNCFFFTH